MHNVTYILFYTAIFPAGFTQRIISPQPDAVQDLCPGDIVTFTCETRGSPIIAWTSEEYIERGATQLDFATFNSIGTEEISPVNPNTVATLINNTIEDGVQVLVSQLRIIVSATFSTSTVTCIDIGTGTINPIMIQLLRMYCLHKLGSV